MRHVVRVAKSRHIFIVGRQVSRSTTESGRITDRRPIFGRQRCAHGNVPLLRVTVTSLATLRGPVNALI